MLSISTPNVHRSIRPKTPEPSPSPPSSPTPLGRQARHSWNCDYTVFPKSRCRQSAARKRIISSGCEDATIGLDVQCQTVRFEQAFDSSVSVNAEEVFQDEIEKSDIQKSERPRTIFQKPREESSSENYRPSNSIPFVKSAPIQRNRFDKIQEDESIENSKENLSKVKETVENEATEKSKDSEFATENNFEDDDFDSIYDPPSKSRNAEKEMDNSTVAKDRKAPVVLSSRMLRAKDLLQESANRVYENSEEHPDEGVPGIPGEEPKDFNNCQPFMGEPDWDTDVESSMLPPLHENTSTIGFGHHERLNNHHILDEEIDNNSSHYVIGFPNPIGENRCWLNATLHAMFALPLIDHLESLGPDALRGVSSLTKTFMALRLFWSKGRDSTSRTYQTVKTFKESLGILDESYPSHRQQDVSEFLTMFLNYLKMDFEKLASRKADQLANESEDSENISENSQDTRAIRCLPQTPTKQRPPLADISPRKRKICETNADSGDCSPKIRKITYSVQDLLSPRVNRLTKSTDPSYKVHTPPHRLENGQRFKENIDFCKNPIDRCVLLHMMEHYECKSCSKHRQKKVDNLMIYVNLPSASENQTVSLTEAVTESLEPEERDLTCTRCKHDKHSVYMSFRAFPKILMVQVKRYGRGDDGSLAKINTPVEIPETIELDLGASEAENGNGAKETYEPVCVIAHVGESMDCGHYTSYVKHGQKWYHYDDLSVTPMTRVEALTAAKTTAYVVFFVRSNL